MVVVEVFGQRTLWLGVYQGSRTELQYRSGAQIRRRQSPNSLNKHVNKVK